MEEDPLVHSHLDCSAPDPPSMQGGYQREDSKRRGWEEGGPLDSMEEEEGMASKKKRAENWQDSEVDGLVAAYRQIHRKLTLAGKKGKHVFRSAQEKWHEVYQILSSMGIDRQPKEIERKWSNLITGYKQIRDWNRRHGHKNYWEMDEHLKKEKTKLKELPATFRLEVYDAISDFLGDSCGAKPRVRVSDSTAAHADVPPSNSPPTATGEIIEIPLQMDKISWLASTMDMAEEKQGQVVLVSIGCFDPPTYLHVRMFELARDALIGEGYHVLGGYMSPINDLQYKMAMASAEHRIKMCQLATSDSHFVMVDPWEAKQISPLKAVSILSRLENALVASDYYPEGTLETSLETRLEPPWTFLGPHGAFLKACGSHMACGLPAERIRVMLLCGSDMLEAFVTSGTYSDQIETLCEGHGIVCISRDGSNSRKCIYDNDFLYENRKNIIIVDDWINTGITSTKARQFLARGLSVKYLMHDNVIRYISLNNLYGADGATIQFCS